MGEQHNIRKVKVVKAKSSNTTKSSQTLIDTEQLKAEVAEQHANSVNDEIEVNSVFQAEEAKGNDFVPNTAAQASVPSAGGIAYRLSRLSTLQKLLAVILAIAVIAGIGYGVSETNKDPANRTPGKQVEPVEWSAWATKTNDNGESYHLEWFPGRVFYLVKYENDTIVGASKIDYEYENGRAVAYDEEDPLMEILTCEENLVTLKMPDGTAWDFKQTDNVIGFDEMDRYLTDYSPIYWASPISTSNIKGTGSDSNEKARKYTKPHRTADGYTYNILGYDWTISFDLEKLIGDDNSVYYDVLNTAMGFEGLNTRTDLNGKVIASSMTFSPEIYAPMYYDIDLLGNIGRQEDVFSVILRSDNNNPANAVSIVDIFEKEYVVSFDQLVLAIYACELYFDGEYHKDPFKERLSDFFGYIDEYQVYIVPC